MLSYAEKAKKNHDMGKQRKKRGNGGYRETKKNCLLPVPRAAAAYGRQLKRQTFP